uniref:MARVEL domain-containing protein n=1 Tax=Steinernema glaseri TaxID=37863 RepID=A0A1I7Y842_9BILA
MGAPLVEPVQYRSFCGLLGVKTATDFIASFLIALGVCIIYHNYGSSDPFRIYCSLFSAAGIASACLSFYGVDAGKPWPLVPLLIYLIMVSIGSFAVFTTATYGYKYTQIVCDYAKGDECSFEEVEEMHDHLHRVMRISFTSFLLFLYFALVVKKCYKQLQEDFTAMLPLYIRFDNK